MKKVAIVVATNYGQTVKIAERLARILEENGLYARVFEVKTESDFPAIPLGHYDAAIVGSPICVGSFAWQVVEFSKMFSKFLNKMPTAIFSVSLNAADQSPKAREADGKMFDEFIRLTNVHPQETVSFIGALNYTKYGWFKRWIMRKISAAHGGPVDTTRDYELTDWDAVETFARKFGLALTDLADPSGNLASKASLH